MIHPSRDVAIAIALLVFGLAAFLFGLEDLKAEASSVAAVFGVIGALVVFFSPFLLLNFWRALRLQRRLEGGQGEVDRWKLSADEIAQFVTAELESDAPRPVWWPSKRARAHGTEVIFGDEALAVDSRYLSLPTSGLQSMRGIRWDEGPQRVLEFKTRLIVTRGATVQTLTTQERILRVPAPDRSAALKVYQHFGDLLSGRRIIAPRRWTVRIRGGLIVAILSALMAVLGYVLAEQNGWRGDGEFWWVPMVMMLLGIFVGFGGLTVAIVSWRFQKMQRGE